MKENKKLKERIEELSYLLDEQKKRNAVLEYEIIKLSEIIIMLKENNNLNKDE